MEGDLVGVSSFGITGEYAHVIMKRNPKAKTRVPEVGKLPADSLPRLLILSDRVPGNMLGSISKLQNMPVDEDFVDLMNNVARDGIRNHMVRGYSVLDGVPNKYKQVRDGDFGHSIDLLVY